MKAVILAGGAGSRLSEETMSKPKPMVEIGGRPILWHIMKIYSTHGIRDFVICLGYKGYAIKEYFANYFLHQSDVTFDLQHNRLHFLSKNVEPWRVTLVDTGQNTMTGGRLLAARKHLEDAPFCMTYGDGVGNIDVARTIAFHEQHQCHATLTAVQAPGRFGSLRLDSDQVCDFVEKPLGDGAWINGGFFVLSPTVLDYIDGTDTVWEQAPLTRLAADGQLMAYKHHGFWQPMDTLRDKHHLETLWNSGHAPWRVWNCATHSGRANASSLPGTPALKVAG